jgi:hypothetical protein
MIMTAESTASTNKKRKSLFIGYALWRGRQFAARLVLTGVLCLTGLPFIGLGLLIRQSNVYNDDVISLTLAAIGVMSMAAQACLALAAALGHMDWLLRPTLTDLRWSLPMKKRSMFLSDFLTGLVPLAVFEFLSGGIFMVIMTNVMTTEYIYDKKMTLENEMAIIGVLVLTFIIGILFFYIANVFVATCVSGTNLTVGGYALFMQIIVPAALAIGFLAVFLNVENVAFSRELMDVVGYTSPAGLMIVTLISLFSMSNSGEHWLFSDLAAGKPGIIITILIMVALIAGAYYLVGRRQSESVGRPSKKAHAVLSSAVLFLVCGLFILGAQSSSDYSFFPIILSMLITTAFVYFIAEMIALSGKKERLKNMGKSAIRYVITVAAAGVIFAIVPQLDAFGASYALPDINNVESVSVRVQNRYSYDNESVQPLLITDLPNDVDDRIVFNTSYYVSTAVFKEKEHIDLIYNIHKKFSEAHNSSGREMLVEYHMKGGGSFIREIDVVGKEAEEDLAALAFSDEYLDFCFGGFEQTYLQGENRIKWQSVFMNAAGTFGQVKDGVQGQSTNEANAGKELYEAYKADRYEHNTYNEIYNATLDGYITVEFSQTVGYDNYSGEELISGLSLRFEVLSNYDRVHAVMEKYNLRFPVLSEYEDADFTLYDKETRDIVYVYADRLTDPADKAIFEKMEGNLRLLTQEDRFTIRDTLNLALPDSITDDEMQALFERLRLLYREYLSETGESVKNSPVQWYTDGRVDPHDPLDPLDPLESVS